MILVADCSALVALSVCGSLNLLEQLFASVVVPETVYLEATQPDKKQAQALKTFLQIERSDIHLSPNLIATVLELAGESDNR